MTTLHIRQDAPTDGVYPIRLTLKPTGRAEMEAEARIPFALSHQEQEDLRWYLEDYLQRAESVEAVTVQQIEATMKARGEELYRVVLAANGNTQALWFSIRNDLANLRVEVTTGVAEAAEAAYQRSLELFASNDALRRSNCIKQIGQVHHERFKDAVERKEPVETLLGHAQAAERGYLEALQLLPEDALKSLAPTHNQLGTLYTQIGQLDNARSHYEQAVQFRERLGDRQHAGETRFNMAVMFLQAAKSQQQMSHQRTGLLRARAYAEAALRDFQHYQGRAAKHETSTKDLIDRINKALAELPS